MQSKPSQNMARSKVSGLPLNEYCDVIRGVAPVMIRCLDVMKLIDLHTHLLPAEPGSALVNVTDLSRNLEPGHLYSAGIHPWHADVNERELSDQLEPLLSDPRVLAVGECGFDTLAGPDHEQQERVFLRQVEMSEKFQKPMILHVVRDFDSVIRIHRYFKPTQRWIIHGFRGGPEQMEQLYSLGLQVSFGARFNPAAVINVPDDRLYLETDGKTGIKDVIHSVSVLRGSDPSYITTLVGRNINTFLYR